MPLPPRHQALCATFSTLLPEKTHTDGQDPQPGLLEEIHFVHGMPSALHCAEARCKDRDVPSHGPVQQVPTGHVECLVPGAPPPALVPGKTDEEICYWGK